MSIEISNAGQIAGSIITTGLRAIAPSDNVEKLIFRRFKGTAIAQSAISGVPINPQTDVQSVTLRVNPAQITFTKRKIINKIQTSAPGRFVVFDWGSELTVLSIKGNTGNLMPAQPSVGFPLQGMLESVANASNSTDFQEGMAITRAVTTGAGYLAPILQNSLMNNSTYFEQLNMSPKYKTFKQLEHMYDMSDADSDVLTLEFGGEAIYRGFFEEFNFDIIAETPWNWAYNIVFVILADLSQAIRRWDDQFNKNNENLKKE